MTGEMPNTSLYHDILQKINLSIPKYLPLNQEKLSPVNFQ